MAAYALPHSSALLNGRHFVTLPEPIIQDGIAYLTPELFRYLDTLARIKAGKPICVLDHQDGDLAPRKCFAYVSFMASAVLHLRESARVTAKEMSIITMANQIDLDMWALTIRPELDWSFIRPERVYHFLVAHEIAHVRHGDARTMFDMQLAQGRDAFTREEFSCAYSALEMRADRDAWADLFPGEPMPLKPATKWTIPQMEAMLERVDEYMERTAWRGKRKMPEPFSTDPHMFVPRPHVTDGIPWSYPGRGMDAGHRFCSATA